MKMLYVQKINVFDLFEILNYFVNVGIIYIIHFKKWQT